MAEETVPLIKHFSCHVCKTTACGEPYVSSIALTQEALETHKQIEFCNDCSPLISSFAAQQIADHTQLPE